MHTKVLGAIEALAALIVIGSVKLWAPVCQGMLTLENGNQVHMKCFYAGQAAILIAAVILVAAIVAVLAKHDHKLVQVVIIAAAIALFVVFTDFIGVCMNSEMMCHTTALWARIGAGVAGVCAVIDLIMGREGQIPS